MITLYLSDKTLSGLSTVIADYLDKNFTEVNGEYTDLTELANFLHSLSVDYENVPLTVEVK